MERRILPRRSTREYWSLSPMPVPKKFEGYIYGAATHLYLKPATWTWLARRVRGAESADTYHGKIMTNEDATKLITVNGPIELTGIEHVIPHPVARDIILQSGEQRIAVLDCPCRAQKEKACEPRDVCLVVGEPFAGFVIDHQPSKTRYVSRTEALSILDAENERGHIHTAWFKDVMHGRFYAICNCCSCCCLGMQSFLRGVPRIAHSGYLPVVDASKCRTCGACKSICPFSAIEATEKTVKITENVCMGCGVCATHCRHKAITLQLAPGRGVPLAIDILVAE
ncbi:MAG TPA: 4Fe-4S binding protein [Candidatus Aquicultor sp.]